MLNDAPVIILSYNRPEKTKKLIKNLRFARPKKIIFSVDGPKTERADDLKKVLEVQKSAELIDWTDDVTTVFRSSNLGLRFAVPSAITLGVETYGQAIVLEDDLEISESFLPFCNWALNEFRADASIMHINGYSAVPISKLSRPDEMLRASAFPQSFGWATWARAWGAYDDSMEWFSSGGLKVLNKKFQDPVKALHWWMILENVRSGRISSWAYRWIQSVWQTGGASVSPNKSLVRNLGYDDGSHNLTKPSWKEPDLADLESSTLPNSKPNFDKIAEEWVSKVQNRNTLLGLFREFGVAAIRSLFPDRS